MPGSFSLDTIHDASLDLVGHDCPLGNYPSIVVPVVRIGAELFVAYSSDGGPLLRRIPDSAKFVAHSVLLHDQLISFTPRVHGLFALAEDRVMLYELRDEKKFFAMLLRSSDAIGLDPFYQLSLAIEADDVEMISVALRECAVRIAPLPPSLREMWVEQARSHLSPYQFLIDEVSKALSEPPPVSNVASIVTGIPAAIPSTKTIFREFRSTALWAPAQPGLEQLYSRGDSGLMTLLHQRYGFMVQKHRKGYYRFSWWRNRRRIMELPFEVPLSMPADREKVARTLGLARPQLEAAEQDPFRFNVRCLLFVLIITRSCESVLGRSSHDFQATLREEADAILEEFEAAEGPENCALLDQTGRMCVELASNPEWSRVGGRALKIVRRGKV
jgi:hypothetical protein